MQHADRQLNFALHVIPQTLQQLHTVSMSCFDWEREMSPPAVLRSLLDTPPIFGIDLNDCSAKQFSCLYRPLLESEPIVEHFKAGSYWYAHLPFMCVVLFIAARCS